MVVLDSSQVHLSVDHYVRSSLYATMYFLVLQIQNKIVCLLLSLIKFQKYLFLNCLKRFSCDFRRVRLTIQALKTFVYSIC